MFHQDLKDTLLHDMLAQVLADPSHQTTVINHLQLALLLPVLLVVPLQHEQHLDMQLESLLPEYLKAYYLNQMLLVLQVLLV